MIIDLLYNIALLLSLSVVYATLPFKSVHRKRFLDLVTGLIIGFAGILIMSRPYQVAEGIGFDSRSILLGVSGMFFGPFPTVLATVVTSFFRIAVGGEGVLAGVMILVTTASIGIVWNSYRFEKAVASPTGFYSLPVIGLEFYLMGVVLHIAMLLCVFALPPHDIKPTFMVIGPTVILIFPVATYLLCMLLFNQMLRLKAIHHLTISEQRFKTFFNQAPLAITLTETRTGRFLDINSKFCDLLGLDRNELVGSQWMAHTHPEELRNELELTAALQAATLITYQLDKRTKRADGSYIWTNIAVTSLKHEKHDVGIHLCMATDISEQKLFEDRIVYANTHDYLTDLHNRAHFEEYIKKLDLLQVFPLAVVMSDINGLKLINDAFGREAGDELLRKCADILRVNLRESDYCARIGGDEFLILLPRTTLMEAERFIAGVQTQVAVEKQNNLEVSLSFGCHVHDDLSLDLNDMLRKVENDINRRKLFESPSMRSKAIQTIINTLHEKNRREELHSQRVSSLCARMGEALGMAEKEINELRTVALLHDIGKIVISEDILNKEGKLDPREWMEIKRHPEIGYRILGSVTDMGEFANTVLAHHERMDGKGYPKGLHGEAIPLHSRIISIADSYDAMTAERTYRQSLSDAQAVEEIKRCTGTQFDPELAVVFVQKVLKFAG